MEQLTVEQMAEINGGTVCVFTYGVTGAVIGKILAGPPGAKAGFILGSLTGAITNFVK